MKVFCGSTWGPLIPPSPQKKWKRKKSWHADYKPSSLPFSLHLKRTKMHYFKMAAVWAISMCVYAARWPTILDSYMSQGGPINRGDVAVSQTEPINHGTPRRLHPHPFWRAHNGHTCGKIKTYSSRMRWWLTLWRTARLRRGRGYHTPAQTHTYMNCLVTFRAH